MPELISTDSRIRRIQRALHLEPDGVLGPDTLTALEARLGIEDKGKLVSLTCSRSSLDELVAFEVTSAAAYEKKYRKPVWPGGESGVTIGIGYDLGQVSKKSIEADWGPVLDAPVLQSLMVAQGVKGEVAKQLAQSLSSVSIPFDVACRVFYTRTLPEYAAKVRACYPGGEKLPADAQGMLLSLVYNRGTSFKGPTRTEMAAIAPLVRGGVSKLGEIAAQFESMVRLWPTVRGLRDRREREAELIRKSNRTYSEDELVRV